MGFNKNLREKYLLGAVILLVVFLNLYLLVFLLKRLLPDYPIGWDVPYYISRARYFILEGVLNKRLASIIIGSVIAKIVGVSLIKAFYYYSILLIIGFSTSTALLSSSLFKGKMKYTAFGLTFTFTTWSTRYFTISIVTLDNALALVCAFFLLYILTKDNFKFKTYLVIILSALVAGSHLETAVAAVLLLFFYLCLLFVGKLENFKNFIIRTKEIFYSLGTIILVAVLYWLDSIKGTLTSYIDPSRHSNNASIPYSDHSSWSEFIRLAHSGLADKIEILLYILAIILIIFFFFKVPKKGRKPYAAILSVFLASNVILLFSVLRASIPINRAILLLPESLILSVGILLIIHLLRHRNSFLILTSLLWVFVLTVNPINAFSDYVKRFPVSIKQSTYDGLNQLREYVVTNNISEIVVATNVPKNEKAASAYFNLWQNWVISVLSIPNEQFTYCVYFGDFFSIKDRNPEIRDDKTSEYSGVSSYSYSSCTLFSKNAPIFFVDGLFDLSENHLLNSGLLVQVDTNLYRFD